MNSFFVPQLGSQIYTMAGMTTHLQLRADNAGSYPGLSAQFSGDGFADMTFKADAMPAKQFDDWVAETRDIGPALDAQSYADLAKPSKAVSPFTYRAVASDLFSRVVMPEMSMNDPARLVCLASSRAVQ
jgi:cytochrome o ubiquinol oxidase subunit II